MKHSSHGCRPNGYQKRLQLWRPLLRRAVHADAVGDRDSARKTAHTSHIDVVYQAEVQVVSGAYQYVDVGPEHAFRCMSCRTPRTHSHVELSCLADLSLEIVRCSLCRSWAKLPAWAAGTLAAGTLPCDCSLPVSCQAWCRHRLASVDEAAVRRSSPWWERERSALLIQVRRMQ